MTNLSEIIRKITTALLATFLWLHALLFFNPQSNLIPNVSRLLNLAPSEVVLLALLVIFSCTVGRGFWKPLRSLIYIYCFPFVLVGYFFYAAYLAARAINRWIGQQSNFPSDKTLVIKEPPTEATQNATQGDGSATLKPQNARAEFLEFLSRPFRRFTFLWCILLLVTTHPILVWISFVIVICHLARDVFHIFQVLFFSGPWFRKLWNHVLKTIETAVAAISIVTPDTTPTAELKNAWNQVNTWTMTTNFLRRESYRVSRWFWIIGIFVCGVIYTYMAFLFSFAYFGIARVNHLTYSWSDALVTSLFIPFYVSELPKIIWLKMLGGFHCVLVVAVGVGTLLSFIQRRVRSFQAAVTTISDRLAQEQVREKFVILQPKVASGSTPATATSPKQS